MKELLRKWISNRIGEIVDLSPDNFTESVKDGKIIARILLSYQIITNDQLELLSKLDNPPQVYNYLKNWLRVIGINVKDHNLHQIATGNYSAALALLHQIYVELQDKDGIYYVSQQKTKRELSQGTKKFKVTPIHLRLKQDNVRNPFSDPIAESWDIISWYKDRMAALKRKCINTREEYQKYLEKQSMVITTGEIEIVDEDERIDDTIFFPPEKYNEYDDLIKQQERAIKMPGFIPNIKATLKTIKNLKLKRKKEMELEAAKIQTQKQLMSGLWDDIKSGQDKFIDKTITEKLMGQSEYEKAMLRKLLDIQIQKHIMVENRKERNVAIMREREQEFIRDLFLREGDTTMEYYLEKKRLQDLHKSIYEERLRIEAQDRYNFCYATVEGIVDISILTAEYKDKYLVSPSDRLRNDWITLFIKGLTVTEFPEEKKEQTEKKDEDLDLEDIPPSPIVVLDEKDFKNYVNKYHQDKDVEDIIDYGMNVLGYMVHKFLLKKYPLAPQPPRPNLPQGDIAVCLVGMCDITKLPVLQKLLSPKKVRVIRTEDVINSCLQAYKDEMEKAKEEVPPPEPPEKGKKGKGKGKDKKGKDKKAKKGKKGGKGKKAEDTKPSKEVETDFDKLVLSRRAELGKIAFDEMATGDSLPDTVLVEMFTEYLNRLQESRWVLINYPTTIDEASNLEGALTGSAIPKRYFIDPQPDESKMVLTSLIDEDFNKSVSSIEDEYLRHSDLLPNPIPRPEDCYETFLTAYIELTAPQPIENTGEDMRKLKKFYDEQGCHYTLDCGKYDLEMFKNLAKLIIGDYELPLKASVELLGLDAATEVGEDLDKFVEDEKKKKEAAEKGDDGKKGKGKGKDKGKGKGKDKGDKKKGGKGKDKKGKGKKGKGPPKPEMEPKETQVPEVVVPKELSVQLIEPRPGEPKYNYLKIRIPAEVEIALATLWENAEQTYIDNFTTVFSQRRVSLNAIAPYLAYVKKDILKCVQQSNSDQMYIDEFKKIIREFDAEALNDESIKDEILERIYMFKEKLMENCDCRMTENENKRKAYLAENFVPTEINKVVNTFVVAFQLEIDRFADSINVINEYYTNMMQVKAKKGADKGLYQKIKLETIELGNSGFKRHVDDKYQKTQKFIEKIKKPTDVMMNDARKNLNDDKKGKKKGKSVMPEWIKDKLPGILDEWECAVTGELTRVNYYLQNLKDQVNKEIDDITNFGDTVFQELYQAIVDKYDSDLETVRNTCQVLIDIDLERSPEMPVQEEQFRFEKEIKLWGVIEEEEEVEEEEEEESVFVMKKLDYFVTVTLHIAPNGWMPHKIFKFILEDMLTSDDSILTKKFCKKLTLKHLRKFFDRVFPAAEFIQWRDFVISNLAISFPDSRTLIALKLRFQKCERTMKRREEQRKLNEEQEKRRKEEEKRKLAELEELMQEEGEHEMEEQIPNQVLVEKKVINLEEEEISNELEIEQEEEEEEDLNFESIPLWFENNTPKSESKKKLLFKMYQTEEKGFNYMDMLVDFCKNTTPIGGFVKALELILGSFICTDEEQGEDFVARSLVLKLRREQRHEAVVEMVKVVLDQLLDEIVSEVDGLVLKEVLDEADGRRKSSVINQLIGDMKNISLQSLITTLTHYLKLETLQEVLKTAFPEYEELREDIEKVFEESRNTMLYNEVLTHQFLKNNKLVELLDSSKKFVPRRARDVLTEILEGKKDKNDIL